MKTFIHEDFLLQSDTAKMLYHDYAESLPIIDYHCHLSPKLIAEDYKFHSITEIWLGGDHYKWRAMRAHGVPEWFITGDAGDWEKFERWADTVPYTLRNPLYHWTHLELKTAFGITDTLNPRTARSIYDRCNECLQRPDRSVRGLLKFYKVEVVCTTDDPVDSLEHHEQIACSGFDVKVLPAWRPDKVMTIADARSYRAYVEKLSEVSGISIVGFDDLVEALHVRQEYFHRHGCRLADHGITTFLSPDYDLSEVRAIFNKVYGCGQEVSAEEKMKYQAALLVILSEMNADRGWVQQYHYGPLRNINTRMWKKLGPDTGFDTIGDDRCAGMLAHLLDRLDQAGKLAKTILYNINPADNDMLAAMIANFQDGSVPGKMQFGSGWWFNDQIGGMTRQMNALSEQGLLSHFIGMLTDSRSFLSFTRHEYFRRILCNLLAADIDRGLLPVSEMERITQMVQDICYYNAKNYLGL